MSFLLCTQKWIIIGSGLEGKEVQTQKKQTYNQAKNGIAGIELDHATKWCTLLDWSPGPRFWLDRLTKFIKIGRSLRFTQAKIGRFEGTFHTNLHLKEPIGSNSRNQHIFPVQNLPAWFTQAACPCSCREWETRWKNHAKTTTAKSCAPCGGQHSSKMTATATETPWRLFETDKLNTDKGGKGTKTRTFARFSASQLAWHTCLIPKGDGKEYAAPTCLTKHPECWSLKVQLLKILKSRSKKYNERPKIKQWRRQRDARVEAVAGEVAPCVHQHIDVIAAPSCQRCSSQLCWTTSAAKEWLKFSDSNDSNAFKCIQVHVGLHVVTINHN